MIGKIIIGIFLIWLLWKIFRWNQIRQTRYIQEFVKRKVLQRYFNMCACCTEEVLLEFHHRVKHADGGDNGEKNIVPLCAKHHAMVTRYG